MKVKDGFILREVGSGFVVVAVGKRASEFNGMISLNETAKVVFEMLQKGATREELYNGLMAEFKDLTKEKAKSDVDKFVDALIKVNVIDE